MRTCAVVGGHSHALTEGERSLVELWDEEVAFPERLVDIAPLPYARYSTVHYATRDLGYLHEAGLEFHAGTLFAGWCHAISDEAAPDMRITARRSRDYGKTWEPLETIAPVVPNGIDRWEYCAFHSHQGRMWMFSTRCRDEWNMAQPVLCACVLDPETNVWSDPQPVIEAGFIATDKIRRLDNGNHILAGALVEDFVAGRIYNRIAISAGDDLTRWRVLAIPHEEGLQWPLVSLMVEGAHITAVMRNSKDTLALVSESSDYGESWSDAQWSNLPMTAVKPFAGVLSTGQRYVVACTPVARGDNSRLALTLAVSDPAGGALRRIWRISRGLPLEPRYPGRTKCAAWAYPKAVEHEGELYIIYSSSVPYVLKKTL